METNTIITKYRPQVLAEVIGNDAAIRGLEAELSGPACPRCFIFSGPAGIGKTTLARIVASMVKAEVREVCAATNAGVDDTRGIVEQAQFAPLTDDKILYIIDECFAPGSIVNTGSGKTPIEQVKIGDPVIGAAGPDTVKCVGKKWVKQSRIFQLILETGSIIMVSEEHPFLTTYGWKKVCEIQKGDFLIQMQEETSTHGKTPRRYIQPDLLRLWDSLLVESSSETPLVSKLQREAPDESLSGMRQRIYPRRFPNGHMFSEVRKNSDKSMWLGIQSELRNLWRKLQGKWGNTAPLVSNMQQEAASQNLSGVQDGILSEKRSNSVLFPHLWQSDRSKQKKGATERQLAFQHEERSDTVAGAETRNVGANKLRSAHKNADKQPNERPEGSGVDFQEAKGSSVQRERGKRVPKPATRATSESNGVIAGVCHSNEGTTLSGDGVTKFVQSGLGSCKNEAGRGGGWTEPLDKETCGAGSKKDPRLGIFGLVRVASIERASTELSRRNCETRIVNGESEVCFYDLTICNHPSYTVEGVVVHNCHALSKQAWQPFLKLMEDPPDHLFIALCTTEANKIPDPIKSRCFHLALKPCKNNEIEMLLEFVCQSEGWVVNNNVFNAIVQAATGQPRKGLSILQTGHLCQNVDELSTVIAGVENEGSPAIALMQLLFSGNRNWDRIRELLSQIEDDEAAWAMSQRWLLAVMLKNPEGKAKMAHTILDALTFPRSGFDRKVQFAVSITSMLWN